MGNFLSVDQYSDTPMKVASSQGVHRLLAEVQTIHQHSSRRLALSVDGHRVEDYRRALDVLLHVRGGQIKVELLHQALRRARHLGHH